MSTAPQRERRLLFAASGLYRNKVVTKGRRRRLLVSAGAAVVILSGSALGVAVWQRGGNPPHEQGCRVVVGTNRYLLDLTQAENASTIAAVGKHQGLADHAVTVALATALQESQLYNLDHGDRDSLGLFQQRPSQGWGTPEQLLDTRYSTTAFYQALVKVDGWEADDVTVAAQSVQHSAAPTAYARWEPEARALAAALTGEWPAGFTCRIASAKGPAPPAKALTAALDRDLGTPNLGTSLTSPRGWTVATWLVAHASSFHLGSVSFSGYQWMATSGEWRLSGDPILQVKVGSP